MKTGGTQYQQLNEEHLSRLIIKLLKFLSQNVKNGKEMESLSPWTENERAEIFDKKIYNQLGDQKLDQSSLIAFRILNTAFKHTISKG